MAAKPAIAQAVVPFSIVGHIQTFTLTAPDNPFSSATMVVNGVTVTIPTNTVVLMPAAYLTPQEIFRCAPPGLPTDPPQTFPCPASPKAKSGLALDDRVTLADPPLAPFEAEIVGNIVGGVHIAGLVRISQQSLNNTAGFIRSISAAGEMCVGASPTPVASCVPPDTRVRINDPTKVYGAINTSPDLRFSVDPDNPTIHAQTGYPMCVSSPGDSGCLLTNRPFSGGAPLTTFVMDSQAITTGLPPAHPSILPCVGALPACDPNKTAPFIVGDFINLAGTLFKDGNAAHPYYISAHTIEANVGIYTKPGAPNIAYVFQEKTILGTLGPLTGPAPVAPCVAALECTARLRIVGFTTDPSRLSSIHTYASDVDATGVRHTRLLSTVQRPQAPFGRFRFDIPRTPTLVPNGLGATREIMVRMDNVALGDNGVPLPDNTVIADNLNSPGLANANGIIAGQYVAPVGEYLFPEGLIMGAPPPAANFQCLAFLTAGWATALTGEALKLVGQLTPWPGTTAPAASAAGIHCDTPG